MSFRKAYIDENPEAVRGFLAAVEDAVRDINANTNQWRRVLLEQKILPQPLAESFIVPEFVTAGVPTEEQFADVLQWAKDKGLVTRDVSYTDTVNATFLPK